MADPAGQLVRGLFFAKKWLKFISQSQIKGDYNFSSISISKCNFSIFGLRSTASGWRPKMLHNIDLQFQYPCTIHHIFPLKNPKKECIAVQKYHIKLKLFTNEILLIFDKGILFVWNVMISFIFILFIKNLLT